MTQSGSGFYYFLPIALNVADVQGVLLVVGGW
jgi:hypothetical protein